MPCLIAALAVSNGSLRSLRCSPGSRRLRRIRRNDCLPRNQLCLHAFRRLLLQIGGANIAGADRAGTPPTSSSLADEKRVRSLLVHCSLRSLRLALVSRCLPHSLADESVSARSLVQDSGAPAWLSTAARDPVFDCSARCARCV